MADIQLIRGSNGSGPAVRPVVTAARSSGSLTLKVNSTTNLPTSFIGTWGKLNQDTGKLISSTIRDFHGQLNGSDIDLVRMADGFTDDGNEIGDVIVLKPNTDWTHNLADVVQDQADTLLVSHNPDGTLLASAVVQMVYPVGSLYFNATNSANPSSLLGFGTWVAFGAGRVPVGFDSSQTEFNSAGKTGGAKTHTLTEAQIPSHTHRITRWAPGTGDFNGGGKMAASNNNGGAVGTAGATNATGGGGAHNNLQPYITVYIWRRTA